jgi:hypothetical protein
VEEVSVAAALSATAAFALAGTTAIFSRRRTLRTS